MHVVESPVFGLHVLKISLIFTIDIIGIVVEDSGVQEIVSKASGRPVSSE
jgi:hypothetical protein